MEEANIIFTSILEFNPQTTTENSDDKNKKIIIQANELLSTLPEPFNINEVIEKYPSSYYESMNIVLLQELIRYNTLLEIIYNSLSQLIQALQGFIIFSNDLEKMSESMMKNMIPQKWASRSYPSLKALSGYNKDLIKRINMFKYWIESGQPTVFWLSGFFFPQSFLTGVNQNYARANQIPIDKLKFDFIVLKEKHEILQTPSKGCYIYGLFLEGIFIYFL